MKKEILKFEERIKLALLNFEAESNLYYSRGNVRYTSSKYNRNRYHHRQEFGYKKRRYTLNLNDFLEKLFEEYGLTPEETKTAYFYFNILEKQFEKYKYIEDRRYLSVNDYKIKEFVKEAHKLYDGIDIIPMSDGELKLRSDYKVYCYNSYMQDVVKAYLYKKEVISSKIFNFIYDWIGVDNENSLYKLEGPIGEEIQYKKDEKLMDCSISSFYTYIAYHDYHAGSEERKTCGWKNFSQVEGFEEAFENFIENFKKTRKDGHDKKMETFKKEGITSRLVLTKEKEGFNTIEII